MLFENTAHFTGKQCLAVEHLKRSCILIYLSKEDQARTVQIDFSWKLDIHLFRLKHIPMFHHTFKPKKKQQKPKKSASSLQCCWPTWFRLQKWNINDRRVRCSKFVTIEIGLSYDIIHICNRKYTYIHTFYLRSLSWLDFFLTFFGISI